MEKTLIPSKGSSRLGGVTALILLGYTLATMAFVFGLGGQPASVQGIFDMLHANRLAGILRLDALTTLVMPLYYLLFLSLYLTLRKDRPLISLIFLLLGCAGLTLFLSAPSFFSWLALSDKYAMTTDPAQKSLLLAAGEGVLASDLWHGSSAFVGGILLQVSTLLASLAMLRSHSFGKWTAWVGVATHSLDLLHILVMPFLPAFGAILMAVGGTLYLLWFPLLASDFLRLARKEIE
ncbi:MAG TPA: hypothetical protein VMC09_03175 [Anaerolineales bacterium]|nr:hypothetical protein [Anaerolineales bacterium]